MLLRNLPLFLLLLIYSAPAPARSISDRIKQKVEALPDFKVLNKEYSIYCIPSIREAYALNDYHPFWTSDSMASEFLLAVSQAGDEGLNPADYHYPDMLFLRKLHSADNRANTDILLTDAFLLLCSHLINGKTNPETIDPEWHVLKTDRNPLKYLTELKSRQIKEILSEVRPPDPDYLLLRDMLRKYRNMPMEEQQEKIAVGPFIKPGMTDGRIPKIRKILEAAGYLTPTLGTGSAMYDDSLKIAMIHFQERHGLEALGNIGNQTIEMLNLTPQQIIKIIMVNMERLRWLPHQLPAYYLVVNIANFELQVIEDHKVVRTHKVIVGRDYRKTPVFSSTLKDIVFNPTWTVPPTILIEDILPEVRKDATYLDQKKISVYNHQGEKLSIDSLDWSNKEVLFYTYRQEPGPSNSLGSVKFMFPNKFNVYLHDTPSKSLFYKTERAFSSGCIRVQDALELAEFLLKAQPGFSHSEIQKIIALKKTQTVTLKRKPDLYLVYLTSWVDDDGNLQIRKDIYERDDKLFQALQEGPGEISSY